MSYFLPPPSLLFQNGNECWTIYMKCIKCVPNWKLFSCHYHTVAAAPSCLPAAARDIWRFLSWSMGWSEWLTLALAQLNVECNVTCTSTFYSSIQRTPYRCCKRMLCSSFLFALPLMSFCCFHRNRDDLIARMASHMYILFRGIFVFLFCCCTRYSTQMHCIHVSILMLPLKGSAFSSLIAEWAQWIKPKWIHRRFCLFELGHCVRCDFQAFSCVWGTYLLAFSQTSVAHNSYQLPCE